MKGSVPLVVGESPVDEVFAGAVAAELVGVLEDEVVDELVAGDAGGVVEECVVVAGVVFVSGSTYCWSPAEVPVPEASAAAATSMPIDASAAEQARIWSRRRTFRY